MYFYNILVAYSVVWVQIWLLKTSAIISANYPAKWSDTPLNAINWKMLQPTCLPDVPRQYNPKGCVELVPEYEHRGLTLNVEVLQKHGELSNREWHGSRKWCKNGGLWLN